MSHPFGTRLNSVHDVESLRARCFCDAHTGCWHFRKADGRRYEHGNHFVVWLYGGKFTTPTRAMWAFHTGKPVPNKRLVYRRCDSFDCINPEHLRCGTKTEAVRFAVSRNGVSATSIAGLKASTTRRTKITPELRAWALESSQTGMEVARCLGVTQSRVNVIRQQERQRLPTVACSIFAMGQAMNAAHMRRTA